MKSPAAGDRDLLLDVSRLIWRVWRGGLPTGIDRVCIAYLRHYAPRSLAVVQRGGRQFVFSPRQSSRLFDVLLSGKKRMRTRLARAVLTGLVTGRRAPPRRDMIYLNVGHTGLNEPTLPAWIAEFGLRAVYMVHDLIPITHPEFCRPAELEKHRRRIANVLSSASGIIGNSQASIDELAAYAATQQASLPPAIAAWISGWDRPPSVEAKKMARPYFVTLGTIEGRKNHQLLIDVWRLLVGKLGQAAPILVIIGQRGWQAAEVIQVLDRPEQLEGHVLELGSCKDRDLAGWIAGARALLMPSFAEGFGLPLIEAMELGTAVIANDLPVFREIAGDIPTYLAPQDADAWRAAILAFMQDGPDLARQKAALKSYRAPNWAGHFKTVDAWLAKLKV